MASISRYLLLSLFLHFFLFVNHTAKCEDEEENLLRDINTYRASLNLSALVENEKADCLAGEMADRFKGQPCTNTTGSNTVPGTEPQFADYPKVLTKCNLNVTTTRDGVVMPACVPNSTPALLLANYTQSQYSQNLNDTKFTGIGIGREDNWVVVVLTTSTPEGGFAADNGGGINGDSNVASKLGSISHVVLLLIVGICMIL